MQRESLTLSHLWQRSQCCFEVQKAISFSPVGEQKWDFLFFCKSCDCTVGTLCCRLNRSKDMYHHFSAPLCQFPHLQIFVFFPIFFYSKHPVKLISLLLYIRCFFLNMLFVSAFICLQFLIRRMLLLGELSSFTCKWLSILYLELYQRSEAV